MKMDVCWAVFLLSSATENLEKKGLLHKELQHTGISSIISITMMANKAILALALVALCAVARANDPTEALPGVKDLTPDNFDKIVDGSKAALIEFYAPWCGHCKSLTPEYKKLGELIAKDPALNARVVIAKVNADDHQSLGERFQVRGFPTIKWFPRGRPTDSMDYNSGRTAEAMLEFIKKQIEYDNSFAVVPPLSEIAIKFTEGEVDAAAALKEAKDAVSKLDDDVKDNAALYIKYLEKAGEKGKEYIETELARLLKMVKGGKMSTNKLVEVSKKISVLESFSKAEVEAEMEGEVGEEEDAEYIDVE